MRNKKDNIYVYLWEDFNAVYVGRTVNPKSRHYQHKHIPTETTYKFSSEHGVEHPKMIIIENDLTIEEGAEREKYWINKYRENGSYYVINKTKGGEIGTSNGIKWTKEAVLKEAKKYTSLSQFKYNNNSAYSAARLNGWLVEMHWFSRPKYIKWTKEATFEEAKKYNKKYHFQIGCEAAYKVALKNGWIAEMDWLKENDYYRIWTKEAIFEESKKYTTLSNFRKKCRGGYHAANINGWLKEMVWLKRNVRPHKKTVKNNETFLKGSNLKWTKEAVFEESKKYGTRNEFKKNSNAYQVAVRQKWLDEMPWLMIVGHYVKWTKETVFEESKKYHTINEFRKNCNTAYIVARKNKWLKDMHWLEKVLKWTKEAVFEESKKYSNRSEFFNGNSVAYRVALKNKWLDEMVWFKHNKRDRYLKDE